MLLLYQDLKHGNQLSGRGDLFLASLEGVVSPQLEKVHLVSLQCLSNNLLGQSAVSGNQVYAYICNEKYSLNIETFFNVNLRGMLKDCNTAHE